jgi:glycine oxidase
VGKYNHPMADVAIIGAGIIGCAIAEELGRRGARVTVFDARDIGAGATQASAGILAPYVEGHQRGPLLEQGVRSLDLYDAFVERLAAASGKDIEYRRCGTLELADTEERFESLRRSAEGHADPVEWVPREALAGFEAGVSADVPGARFCQAHGYVVVGQLLDALVAAARRSAVDFHGRATVADVSAKNGRFTLQTTAGDFTATAVVVCAGGWSSQLEFAAELEDRVRPIRGQLVYLRRRGEPLRHILWSSGCYIVPWKDGTVLVGATAEDVGFEERATVTGVRDLLDAACEVLPSLWNADFLGVKVGLRPASEDGLPIVCTSVRTPRLFFATGHYRNGILLAPLTAVQMADMVSAR